ncbi:hypothetical protein BCR42DRAFT_430487 [Absidia repens]|uniref:Uncharacterized protein n=1 Tax=Absidia repens TaxID=90262 RepID=A0A1X2HDZ7_9FUNG|nr:hypothetical protein BCR42DRAFT_430487 [Absidia repens]
MIHDLLRNLVAPGNMDYSIHLWLLCSCTIQAISRHHWLFILHNTPFNTANVISLITHLFSRLRPPPRAFIIPISPDTDDIPF